LARDGHAIPQPPQWRTSLAVATSQPLVATASQSAKPAVQVVWQAPATHAPVAPAAVGQVVVRAPSPSALQTLTDVGDAQAAAPGVHVHARQVPAEQVSIGAQATVA